MVVAFQREGKSYEEARAMADEISQDKDLWLRTMAEKELGISFEETTKPKPRWDVHLREGGNWAGSPPGGPRLLIAGRSGSAV